MSPWIDKPAGSGALLPGLANIDLLPALLRAKLKLCLLGEERAFDDGVPSQATFLKHQRTIRKFTGVDIEVPFFTGHQRRALLTFSELFACGLRYEDCLDKWPLLRAANQ